MRWIVVLMLAARGAAAIPCGERVIDALYARGLLPQFANPAELRFWRDEMPRLMGMEASFLEQSDQRLKENPQLLDLMAGIPVPGTWGRSLRLSGGWGEDYLWAPLAPHWDQVRGNFGPMVQRMEQRLHLHPILRRQMFQSDLTSLADSGWVICQDRSGNDVRTGSVKITYYDRHLTPDVPWPRYSVESILDDQAVISFRRPGPHDWPANEMLRTPYFSLRSSMDAWGLLPLETHTGFRVPEHDPVTYFPQHDLLFCERFLLAHRELMENVLESFGSDQASYHLNRLMSFRNEMFPPQALEIAELQRFNIPEGSSPATRAHLFFGLTVMLKQRPIQTLYLMAPKPHDPLRPANTFPRTEIAFIAPGFESWRAIIEAAAREMDGEVAEYPDPQQDPLRDLYLGLGFEIVKSLSHCRGTPNGCYVMKVSRTKLLENLVAYQRKKNRFLSPEQRAYLDRYFPN